MGANLSLWWQTDGPGRRPSCRVQSQDPAIVAVIFHGNWLLLSRDELPLLYIHLAELLVCLLPDIHERGRAYLCTIAGWRLRGRIIAPPDVMQLVVGKCVRPKPLGITAVLPWLDYILLRTVEKDPYKVHQTVAAEGLCDALLAFGWETCIQCDVSAACNQALAFRPQSRDVAICMKEIFDILHARGVSE